MKLLVILIVLILNSFYCLSEDFWKPCIGIGSPSGVVNITVSDDGIIYAASEKSLFKSSDDGLNWTKITLGNEKFKDHLFLNGSLKCDKKGNLYILTHDAFYKLNKDSDIAALIFQFSFSTENYYSLSLSSDGTKIIVMAENEIHVSNDSGKSWKQINLSVEGKLGLLLFSVTYDENYGIIKNYVTHSFPKEFYVYHTIDDGLTWHQLKNIPGRDDIPIEEVKVINDNLWAVGLNVYNFRNRILLPISIKDCQQFFSNSNGIYFSDYNSIYFSYDEGMNWGNITEVTFKEDGLPLDRVDAFYAAKSGSIYAGSRYKRLKKSSDNGKTWERIFINNYDDVQFSDIKKVDTALYATDHTNYYFESLDKGKSWAPKIIENSSYSFNFDIIKFNEYIYNNGQHIVYTSDSGRSWQSLNNSSVGMAAPDYQLKFFGNGVIVGRRDESSKTFMFPDYGKNAEWLTAPSENLFLMNNGQYLDFTNSDIYLIEPDFNSWESITASLTSPNGNKPVFHNFCIGKDSSMYLATNRGIFRSDYPGANFKTLSLKDTVINQIFIDDNNYLFISIGQRILYSKDKGKSWKEINSNLGLTRFEYFYAHDTSKLIAKSDKVYYADLNEDDFLYLSASSEDTYLYNNSPIEISYRVIDDFGNPVDSALIVLFNSITCLYDTLTTDSDGNAVLTVKIDYYNQNAVRDLKIIGFADKDNYIKSTLNIQEFTYYTYRKDLQVKVEKDYIIVRPDTNFTIPISFTQLKSEYYQHLDGTLLIKDALSGQEKTIPYNKGKPYSYNVNVPSGTAYGMYRIAVRGINLQNDSTTEVPVYVVVIDSIPKADTTDSDTTNPDVVKNSKVNRRMKIIPNPADDFIEINISNNGLKPVAAFDNVRIYNTLGIDVSPAGEGVNGVDEGGNIRIDISHLTAGVYYIKIGDKVEKFVKK
ncbi:MAG: T9SS type A sorting domain-containing protein [Candidatus Kapabacteria bacterium]|nr:T9SS type A sorting domain-containing protein [Candidatus Kapabacteria bacterium]